jgi:hypothetical protein
VEEGIPMTDFDSPWKQALEVYFQAFLAFFFPAIHNDIDWSRGFETLDKELQQIAPRSAQSRLYVDKLVKVWRKNGREVWVLLHVEVQTQRQHGFARRLYVYNGRIFARYNERVVSVALLADDNPKWRPNRYEDELWGWSQQMIFPTVKLLDYGNREAALEMSTNPFAHVVLAHLKALETRRDPEGWRVWKFRLVRGLYERGFQAEDVRQLFLLVDWLMELPRAHENLFWEEVHRYEEEKKMPFVSTPERYGIRKGILLAIEDLLRAKFGAEGIQLLPEISALGDADNYLALHRLIFRAATLDEVRRACVAAAAPQEPPKKKTRCKRE